MGSNPTWCSKLSRMITLTSKAAEKIKKFSIEDNLDLRLRIKVIGGGCAGFQYDVYFDELEPTDFDDITVQDDIIIAVDPLSLQYVDGTTLDYVIGEFTEGFKFNNPNITAECGCGSSFKA